MSVGASPAGLSRPDPSEYDAFYGTYVDQVPDGDILALLESGVQETRELLGSRAETEAIFRYDVGKWSVKEVLGHMNDAERVFQFRALAFARSDPAAYPGMDQDVYAAHSNAHDRPIEALLEDADAVRKSTLTLFRGLDSSALLWRGRASGVEFSVRSLAWIIAGHEIHHRKVLRERYLDL